MASKQKLYNECYKSISLVLNADRDFYQAYLAKVKYGSTKSESDKKDYEENVKQVEERINDAIKNLEVDRENWIKIILMEKLHK